MTSLQAIEVRDVRKTYRRFGRRRQFGTLKSALLTGRLFRDLRPSDSFDALKGVSFDVAAGNMGAHHIWLDIPGVYLPAVCLAWVWVRDR